MGFNLKTRKAKQAATGSYLYLSLKWRSCLQQSQNENELRAVSSHLIFLSSAGTKGVHHYCAVSIAN